MISKHCVAKGLILILVAMAVRPVHAWIPDPEANGLKCVGGGCGTPSVPPRSEPRTPTTRAPKPPQSLPPTPSPVAILAQQQRDQARSRLKQELLRLQILPRVEKRQQFVESESGTAFFNLVPGRGAYLAAPLANVQTSGTQIPLENLRRAAAILMTISATTQDCEREDLCEDLSFLATQAALAMEGAPVQLDISDAAVAVASEKAHTLVLVVDELKSLKNELDQILATRLAIEAEVREIARADRGSHARDDERLRMLSKRYTADLENERRVRTRSEELIYVIHLLPRR